MVSLIPALGDRCRYPARHMNSNPYESPVVTNETTGPDFPWLAIIGLLLVICATAVSAIAILEGYNFLSLWYGYRGNSNAPSIVWRGRFNVRPMMGLYQFAFVTCLFSAGACLLTRGSRKIFRIATLITIAGFAFWIVVGLKYAFYRF